MSQLAWSDLSADHLPAAQRFDFWRESFLKLSGLGRATAADCPDMRVRRCGIDSPASGIGFWRSDAAFGAMVELERTPERCRRDDADGFYIAFPIEPIEPRAFDAGGAGTGAALLQPGQALVHDLARPFCSTSSGFSYFGVTVQRRRVVRALGPRAERFAGQAPMLDAGSCALLYGHAAGLVEGGTMLSQTTLQASLDFLGNVVLEALGRKYADVFPTRRSHRDLAMAAKRLVIERLDDPTLSVESIARFLGVSRSVLYAAFRGEAQGIAAFVTMARLDRACDLLAKDDRRLVGEVAFACGFDSMSTFNRLFRRQFGRTPSQARAEADGPERQP
jgi:AraC-like DNA-binding protein